MEDFQSFKIYRHSLTRINFDQGNLIHNVINQY